MDRLNDLIIKRRVTNYRMARDLEISEGAVRSWRKGRTEPKGKNLQRLAEYLGVSAAWLLYGEESSASHAHGELTYIFRQTEDFIKEHPEATTYIENMLKGVIRGGDFPENRRAAVPAPKQKKRQKSA